MTSKDVAALLREIGLLLQLKGENPFKTRAYETAADAFEAMVPDPAAPGGLYERVRAGTLGELAGVGKAIDQKVTELVKEGRLEYLEKLRAEFPSPALELVRVPGVGPKRAALLMAELKPRSLEEVAEACRAGRVREMKGFGERMERQILEGIAEFQARGQRRPLTETRPQAEALLARVRAAPGVVRAEIAGSVRRYAEMNADVDLVASTAQAGQHGPAMDAFANDPDVQVVLSRGDTKTSVRLRSGLQADLRVVPDAQFATALHHFTGSKAHHVKLRGLARDQGLTISEYALARLDTGEPLPVQTEAQLYERLGLRFVPPELREDHGEIEAARAGPLPELVALDDVRGYVHCHTTWSDGAHSVEEMARAALAEGRQYIVISDHSEAAHYAGGLSADRLKRQWDEIAAVQQRLPQIRILRGSEVDILEDGRLDLPDPLLEQLDVVIASVHQRFQLDEEGQTRRLRNALSHPRCQIWGHPTGRLLADRPPIHARWDELFELAAEKGVAIECNGTPRRLDFGAELLLRARERGCKVCLSVDAHSTRELDHLPWAVGTARRGWTERARVVNARPADEFLSALRR
jgi:DNA polymerase (family 10)